MTVSSLTAAMAVGVLLGLIARWTLPAGRRVPSWVLLAVAVSAAVLGTVIGRLAGIDTSTLSPVEVVLQLTFAGTAVGLVAATADRRPPDHRYDRDNFR